MKFDEYGYPRLNGASDFDDSSHLAGVLALTEHPQAIDMRKYIRMNGQLGKPFYTYMRHPSTKVDCSRDQAILVMCGLLKQGYKDFVRTEFVDGKDIIYPSVHGIETIAKTGQPTWFQRKFFHLELDFKCRNEGSMIGEPFQDMAKAIVYDDLKLLTKKNYLWDVSILRYLRGGDCKWRNEPELAEHVIKYVEGKI